MKLQFLARIPGNKPTQLLTTSSQRSLDRHSSNRREYFREYARLHPRPYIRKTPIGQSSAELALKEALEMAAECQENTGFWALAWHDVTQYEKRANRMKKQGLSVRIKRISPFPGQGRYDIWICFRPHPNDCKCQNCQVSLSS